MDLFRELSLEEVEQQAELMSPHSNLVRTTMRVALALRIQMA